MKDSMKAVLFVAGLVVVMACGAFFLLRPGATSAAVAANTPGNAGVQEVRMAVVGYKYEPETITIKAGVPVRWVIDATQASGCAHSIVLSKYSINAALQGSNNIFTFTPTQTGTLSFSCNMGMVRGQFEVV